MWNGNEPIRLAVQPDVEDMQVHVEHGLVRRDYPVHIHAFYETFIFVDGKAKHVRGDQAYDLHRGDVFAVGGHTAHGFLHVQDMKIINLMYDPGFFRRSHSEIRRIPGFDACFLVEPERGRRRADRPVLRLGERDLNYAVMMADFIQEQQSRSRSDMRPAIRMHFMALFSFLATRYESQEMAAETAAISRALAYMESHLEEPLRVSQIAAETYFSVRQLERAFHGCFGESPMQYLKKIRLEKACSILKEGRSVADTARECGFEDPAYFTRVFRAQYGCLPMDVRKGRQNGS